MTGDYQEAPIWCKAHTLDRKLPIEVKELQALQLEVIAIVFIHLENLKNTFFVANCEILSIRGEITALGGMS